ncbi:PncC family amidohydrolase [Chitinophaga terrae (ex Kim and Jung 2007)]|uniref:CinA family protein n=1 Tax=Chitinophaga terrae (ex Kim and Jung 2007) TaxID=408074 RepID=UPI00278768A4|nr:CinA family protein [Chitinophaga terrae (ex Kim and Jung 2007)]MDQ0108816.1 PncC family amidohydrolase [Chitinophaga terrae (ex Kim and Jung 2007)]
MSSANSFKRSAPKLYAKGWHKISAGTGMINLDLKLIDQIGKKLITRKETIAVAESVTAGLLQTGLSSGGQATSYFQGGITVYNLGQKVKHLGLDPIHGEACNCVSSDTAKVLSANCCGYFISHWALGITGYASPVPELGIEKVFAFYAIAYNHKIVKAGKITPKSVSDPVDIRTFYANTVFGELDKLLRPSRV